MTKRFKALKQASLHMASKKLKTDRKKKKDAIGLKKECGKKTWTCADWPSLIKGNYNRTN